MRYDFQAQKVQTDSRAGLYPMCHAGFKSRHFNSPRWKQKSTIFVCFWLFDPNLIIFGNLQQFLSGIRQKD
jgi:hypothetical protein